MSNLTAKSLSRHYRIRIGRRNVKEFYTQLFARISIRRHVERPITGDTGTCKRESSLKRFRGRESLDVSWVGDRNATADGRDFKYRPTGIARTVSDPSGDRPPS